MPTIFSKIIAKEIPATIVYQDELVTAFKDINPSAPVHILIVPNKEIASTNDVQPEDEHIMGHLFTVAKQVAKEQGVAESGYRLIINNGSDSGQEVFHLHMHLIGGRKLGPLVHKAD
ncbi:MAG: histidine triad nucleotide-binding protein [Chloroflexi bacterium]|nr:histidine triad nucleotide-binding protein [Chloroflexota bacterium]MCC6896967.1 histidine triad nucleotide-binding protein [Anaerolineae bacterium]